MHWFCFQPVLPPDPEWMVTMPDRTSSIMDTTRTRKTRPLSWHLLMLCLALVVPILVLAGVLASFYIASQRAYLDSTGLDAARRRA
jgi:hypothetical protein